MDIANISLSLGGDGGNTITKFAVTPAEVVILQAIHGEDSVRDIEPIGEVERSNKEELDRLREEYRQSRVLGSDISAFSSLFPGAGAQVMTTFAELAIDPSFYAAKERVSPAAPKPPSKTQQRKQAEAFRDAAAEDQSQTPASTFT